MYIYTLTIYTNYIYTIYIYIVELGEVEFWRKRQPTYIAVETNDL